MVSMTVVIFTATATADIQVVVSTFFLHHMCHGIRTSIDMMFKRVTDSGSWAVWVSRLVLG